MRGLSQAAIRAMYSSETEQAVILLLTVYDPEDNTTEVLHLADNFTQRLNQYTTDTDVIYGVSIKGIAGSVSVQSSDYNGTTANINSYFKVNGTKVNYTFTRGHTVMVLNPATFAVESITTYDTYGLGNSQSLKTALQAIPTGKLVCIGSYDATSLDQSTRDYITQQFYSTRTETWNALRYTHTLIGVKGNQYVKPIEIVTAGSSGFLSEFILNSTYNSSNAGYTPIWSTAELPVGNSAIISSTNSGYCSFLNQYGVWLKDDTSTLAPTLPPVINSLTWSPTTISANGVDTATLSWNTSGGNTNSVNILISNQSAPITGQPAIGSYVVGPYSGSSIITGSITITGPGGTTTQTPITLTVNSASTSTTPSPVVDPRANWVPVYGTQEEINQIIFWRDSVTGQVYNYDGTPYVPFNGNSVG